MIKLYLDEDVHKRIALALRIKGYEVISAHEAKNWNLFSPLYNVETKCV